MASNHYQQLPIRVELPGSSGVPGSAALDRMTQITLPGRRLPSKREQYIAQKARETLMIQLAAAGVTEHARTLIKAITLRSMESFDEVIEFDRSIRDKPRDSRDQADVEVFNQSMRQMFANATVAINTAGIGQIQDVVNTAFTPPEDDEPQVIVEQEPGFFGKLFGGQKVTKVLR